MSHEIEPRNAQRELRLDPEQRAACLGNRRVVLGRREYDVLRLLLEAEGAAVSTVSLLQGAWAGEQEADAARVRQTVTRLRRKLGDRVRIETIVGEGYCLAYDKRQTNSTS